ncbi:Hypothetical predicted protein, partial [Paramuricea clavata]
MWRINTDEIQVSLSKRTKITPRTLFSQSQKILLKQFRRLMLLYSIPCDKGKSALAEHVTSSLGFYHDARAIFSIKIKRSRPLQREPWVREPFVCSRIAEMPNFDLANIATMSPGCTAVDEWS